LIDSKTSSFIRFIESQTPTDPSSTTVDIPQATKEGGVINSQIIIEFYEKVTRRASWWATKAAESEICWEKWELNCEFLAPARSERGITPLRMSRK